MTGKALSYVDAIMGFFSYIHQVSHSSGVCIV